MKSHFVYSKQQRNGIFLLLLLIIVLQCIWFFIDFSSNKIQVNKHELVSFIKEIDSLKEVEIELRKPKVYPFNPNYITDYKGANLGMTTKEIDRLLAYRNQNKWINSKQQFQEITKVSDSLLNKIAPLFKFPEWITQSQQSKIRQKKRSFLKTFKEKKDLNKVTAKELEVVNGLGKVLSKRIIRFRNKFKGGFIADIQLQDVYGITKETIQKITNQFTVKTPRIIQKIGLNTATINQLVTIQHIDYDLAYRIKEQRILKDGYKSINELIKVKDFPINKIDIIKLYLSLD